MGEEKVNQQQAASVSNQSANKTATDFTPDTRLIGPSPSREASVFRSANDASAKIDATTVADSVDLTDPSSNRLIKDMRGRNSTKASEAYLASFELTDSSSNSVSEKSGKDLKNEFDSDDLLLLGR